MPRNGYVDLKRIMDIFQALKSYVTMLQVQVDRKQHPPAMRARDNPTLKRNP